MVYNLAAETANGNGMHVIIQKQTLIQNMMKYVQNAVKKHNVHDSQHNHAT